MTLEVISKGQILDNETLGSLLRYPVLVFAHLLCTSSQWTSVCLSSRTALFAGSVFLERK